MRNAIPLAFLIGGVIAAGAYAYLGVFANDVRPIKFAIACLVAVIGWHELMATSQCDESGESGSF